MQNEDHPTTFVLELTTDNLSSEELIGCECIYKNNQYQRLRDPSWKQNLQLYVEVSQNVNLQCLFTVEKHYGYVSAKINRQRRSLQIRFSTDSSFELHIGSITMFMEHFYIDNESVYKVAARIREASDACRRRIEFCLNKIANVEYELRHSREVSSAVVGQARTLLRQLARDSLDADEIQKVLIARSINRILDLQEKFCFTKGEPDPFQLLSST